MFALPRAIVSFWKAGTCSHFLPCYTTTVVNRQLVIPRRSPVPPSKDLCAVATIQTVLKPSLGTWENRTAYGVAQGVCGRPWQVSLPINDTSHWPGPPVAYPHPCLSSHTASREGGYGLDDAFVWARPAERGFSRSGEGSLSPLSGWLSDTQEGVWLVYPGPAVGSQAGAQSVQAECPSQRRDCL